MDGVTGIIIKKYTAEELESKYPGARTSGLIQRLSNANYLMMSAVDESAFHRGQIVWFEIKSNADLTDRENRANLLLYFDEWSVRGFWWKLAYFWTHGPLRWVFNPRIWTIKIYFGARLAYLRAKVAWHYVRMKYYEVMSRIFEPDQWK